MLITQLSFHCFRVANLLGKVVKWLQCVADDSEELPIALSDCKLHCHFLVLKSLVNFISVLVGKGLVSSFPMERLIAMAMVGKIGNVEPAFAKDLNASNFLVVKRANSHVCKVQNKTFLGFPCPFTTNGAARSVNVLRQMNRVESC